ncbi:MAG: hypothetical protein K5779_06060 [Saccharofermentans sp.]|nr:hypothetical protein [Saccharofermentans sp.]
MTKFNDIGISKELDWDRISHLFKIGIVAALMALVGDIVLGWGVVDNSLSGMEQYFSRYLTVSDDRIFRSAVLGLIGIPVECLCYFGIYRLIVNRNEKLAHIYRSGLLGMLAFGSFCHVVCCATVYHLNAIHRLDTSASSDGTIKFALYFLVPVTAIFLVFFLMTTVVQIVAFAKGYTPYPKWCWIFSIASGLVIVAVTRFFGSSEAANAIGTGWISIGSIWTYLGLLIMMKKAKAKK